MPGHRLAPRVRVHTTAPLAPLAPLSARAAEGAAAAAFAGGARARAPALAGRGAAAAAALEAPRPCEVACEVVAVRHLDAAGLDELEAAASDAAGGAVAVDSAEELAGCGGAAVHGCAVWVRLSGAPTQATLRISHEPSAAASAARRDQQEAALAGTALAGAALAGAPLESEQEGEEEGEQEAPGLWAAARGGGGGGGGFGGGGGGAALGAAPAEVLPAEVSLHLTGPALVLHASCASSSAVSGQLVGPVTLHALDAARHQVCGAHFEPRLAARRPQTAEATAAAAEAAEAAEAEAEAEAGAGAAAAAAAGAGAVQCTIERTEWQRSPSGACELAQVWLRLSGEPGEVELTPHPTRTLALTLSLTWP